MSSISIHIDTQHSGANNQASPGTDQSEECSSGHSPFYEELLNVINKVVLKSEQVAEI